MLFYIMTDPSPDEYFHSVNVKANEGNLVLCVITEDQTDIDLFRKESSEARNILTMSGLALLQNPVYIGDMGFEERKQHLIDVINEAREEIMQG